VEGRQSGGRTRKKKYSKMKMKKKKKKKKKNNVMFNGQNKRPSKGRSCWVKSSKQARTHCRSC